MARDYRSKMLGVRLLPALLLVIPLGASATIYQWTDEQGHVVIGNQVPETGVSNLRPIVKEDPAPSNSNRELEERIARLERQLQAAQAAPAPAPYPVAPMPYAAAPPSIPADYYGAPYYPFGYGYPLGVVSVVRPVRGFMRSPRFASRSFTSFHAGVHRR
jgi:hypothetical protein